MQDTTEVVRRDMVRHFAAAIAYRTQKAVRGAPEGFADFAAGNDARTPRELVRHMTGVIGYARTYFIGGVFGPHPVEGFQEEVERFHVTLADLAAHLGAGTPLAHISLEQLLQGPLSDAMTHAGQLAMLRRLAGSPVESENFIFAVVSPDNLGPEQPLPAAPDNPWLGKLLHTAWRIAAWRNRRRG